MRPKTLDHIALWVADRDRIAAFCCSHLGMHEIANEEKFTLVGSDARRGKLTLFDAEGLRIRLVEAPTAIEYDLDHVALLASDPAAAADEYASLGFEPTEPTADGNPRVEVGGAYVELHEGDPGEPGRPLLNHIAVHVDSAQEHIDEGEERGIVESVVDAANTVAVFLWGPDRVRVEYVEHKPTFSLT